MATFQHYRCFLGEGVGSKFISKQPSKFCMVLYIIASTVLPSLLIILGQPISRCYLPNCHPPQYSNGVVVEETDAVLVDLGPRTTIYRAKIVVNYLATQR